MASEERLLERCGRPSSVFFSVSSMSFEAADIFAKNGGFPANQLWLKNPFQPEVKSSSNKSSTSRFFSKNEQTTLLLYTGTKTPVCVQFTGGLVYNIYLIFTTPPPPLILFSPCNMLTAPSDKIRI
jgi:hypothetical protein